MKEENKSNGLSVFADKDFGAIELSMIVGQRRVGFWIDTQEAERISDALKDAVQVMKKNQECNNDCGFENLTKKCKNYREDKDGNELLHQE